VFPVESAHRLAAPPSRRAGEGGVEWVTRAVDVDRFKSMPFCVGGVPGGLPCGRDRIREVLGMALAR
jgi:hypothetical protein